MRLISIHPAMLLVNYKSCRRRVVPGASVFAPFSRRSFRPTVARQTQRALLTLCLGRFDTGVEIGHALVLAFGIASVNIHSRSDRYQIRGPRAKTQISRNVRSQRTIRARKSSPARVYAPKRHRRCGTCMSRSDILPRKTDVSDLILVVMTNITRISLPC